MTSASREEVMAGRAQVSRFDACQRQAFQNVGFQVKFSRNKRKLIVYYFSWTMISCMLALSFKRANALQCLASKRRSNDPKIEKSASKGELDLHNRWIMSMESMCTSEDMSIPQQWIIFWAERCPVIYRDLLLAAPLISLPPRVKQMFRSLAMAPFAYLIGRNSATLRSKTNLHSISR